MKALLGLGLAALIVGLASLLVPIPFRQGSILTTPYDQRLSPLASEAIILGGVGMLMASQARRT